MIGESAGGCAGLFASWAIPCTSLEMERDLDALVAHATRALCRPPERVMSGSPSAARRGVARTDLERTRSPRHAVSELVKLISESGVSTRHRRHFGWMNPPAHPAAAVADLLVSGLNPQLAVRALSPGPVEAERRLLNEVGARLGLADDTDGHFTSGGSEANATALICALTAGVPEFAEHGLAGAAPLRVYASEEAHDSLDKAVRAHGLGSRGLCRVPVDAHGRLSLPALERAIEADRAAGWQPRMLVSTAGTTNLGAIDPLPEVGALAARHGLWHHVDAAWGGLLAFTEQAGALDGLADADSVTFDPHKALAAPMGTGMFFVRPGVLADAFETHPRYGPETSAPDPCKRSLVWSRRFVGARLWLPLLLEGWPGLVSRVQRRCQLGARLREVIEEAGYEVIGPRGPLPVVCFRDPNLEDTAQHAVASRIAHTGEAWLATTRVAGRPCLRACVCSDETDSSDLEQLGRLLQEARA